MFVIIVIINGIIYVGFENDEINEFVKLKDVIKISKRDFGYVLVNKKNGGIIVFGIVLVV